MLGNHSYTLSEEKGFRTGNFTSIAGGCVFHNDDNHAWVESRELVSVYPFAEKWEVGDYPHSNGRGDVQIGNDVWIGEGCHFSGGIKVGDGAIVGFRSVVTKDVPPYAIVAGNPAKVVKYRFDKKTIEELLKIHWWTWDEGMIRDNMNLMKDVKQFIQKHGQKT